MSLEFFDPRKGITISISLFLVNAKYFEICSTAIDGTDNIKLMIGKYSLNALMISTLLNYKKLVMLLLFYITMANSSLITVIFHVFRQKHLVLLSLFKTKTKQEKYSSFQIDSSKQALNKQLGYHSVKKTFDSFLHFDQSKEVRQASLSVLFQQPNYICIFDRFRLCTNQFPFINDWIK